MGFFKKLFHLPEGKISKKELIRFLVKKRIRENAFLAMVGVKENDIDRAGIVLLSSLPEATIVTLVELYVVNKRRGMSDQENFHHLEARRPGKGIMPSPLVLESFIQYRIDIESKVEISEEFVREAVRICCENYGV